MKKNYFFLIILFVVIASLKANAFNITVNVDDASRVTLYLGSSKQEGVSKVQNYPLYKSNSQLE